jgi:hypothetical protein
MFLRLKGGRGKSLKFVLEPKMTQPTISIEQTNQAVTARVLILSWISGAIFCQLLDYIVDFFMDRNTNHKLRA